MAPGLVGVNGVGLKVNRYSCRRPNGTDGQHPAVVLIHGLTVDHSGLGFTVGMPLTRTAEVLLYDLRGHGRSEMVPSGYRVTDHVADLVALLDAQGMDQPVHLVGGSYGGAVAAAMALEHPQRVASLGLIEGLIPHPGWGGLVARTMEQAADKLRHGLTADQAMAELGISSRRKAVAMAERARRLLVETTMLEDVRSETDWDHSDYARISCPVLGLYGDRSDIYGLTSLLATNVPDVRIHTLEGLGHMEVFWYPQRLRDVIATFVEDVHALAPTPRAG